MMGRPVRYGGEFGGVKERADYMAGIAARALAPIVIETSAQFERRIEREPHGVVFVIAPWNYPYLTAINTVPRADRRQRRRASSMRRRRCWPASGWSAPSPSAGMPEDLFQNVFLDHQGTEKLIAEGASTSSTSPARSAAAGHRARSGGHLHAARSRAWRQGSGLCDGRRRSRLGRRHADGRAMFNSGQCCCGIERIYVASPLYDAFVEKATAWVTSKLKLGNPLDPETTIGPMANVRFARTVRAQIEDALCQGRAGLVDPALFPADDGGAYLAPQILVDVNHDMEVMREESFGPWSASCRSRTTRKRSR
jgi:hypothetical protein